MFSNHDFDILYKKNEIYMKKINSIKNPYQKNLYRKIRSAKKIMSRYQTANWDLSASFYELTPVHMETSNNSYKYSEIKITQQNYTWLFMSSFSRDLAKIHPNWIGTAEKKNHSNLFVNMRTRYYVFNNIALIHAYYCQWLAAI